jgi:uncharacterized Ntn-hydrolase superfamily protein
MTDAYHAGSALDAEAALLALAKELDRTHPGAAASLREGLDETLAGARPGWSRPASSSAASTVTSTYRHSEQLSNVKSPSLLGPTCTMTK